MTNIPTGFKPWTGGDKAPDDYDGGRIMHDLWLKEIGKYRDEITQTIMKDGAS